MVDILNFQRHESKYRNVLRWTVDTHQESIHFRNPKIRVPRWNEQPLRNCKTLPSGTENANVDAKKNGLLSGDCMEFQPGNDRTGCCFFSMNQKPWQQTCHDTLKKWRVLAKVSIFSCWDAMELRPGQMPIISALGIFTCGATSTAHLRFTTCLQKGKPWCLQRDGFPKEKEMVWTGIKIPLFNVNMHPLTSFECIFKNATQLRHSGSVPFLGFGNQRCTTPNPRDDGNPRVTVIGNFESDCLSA